MCWALCCNCRSWLGIHCLPSSSCYDAFSSDLGNILFHYDHSTGTRQWGQPTLLTETMIVKLSSEMFRMAQTKDTVKIMNCLLICLFVFMHALHESLRGWVLILSPLFEICGCPCHVFGCICLSVYNLAEYLNNYLTDSHELQKM